MKLHEALDLLTVDDLKQRRKMIPGNDRSTRKADILEAIARYLLAGDLGIVWAQLSELEINAVAEAVHSWGGAFDPIRFRAKYGALPTLVEPPAYSWQERQHGPKSLLPLFFYLGEIPEDVRPRLAGLAPQPAELPFTTLRDAELPETLVFGSDQGTAEPVRQIATEAMVRHDLPAVLRLVAQGGVAVGAKTGLPSAAAVAKVEAILLGGDWYSTADDWDSERWSGGPIRPIRPFAWAVLLQAAGLAKRDGNKLALTPRGNKAMSRPIEEVVSHLFERWQLKGTPDELKRVDLIKGQTSKGARLTALADRRAAIARFLRECPVGSWIAVDELFRQMQLRGHRFEVSHNSWGLYFSDPQYGSLGYDGCGGFEILQARYMLAYLFEYLATLGMIDVAYTTPYHARPDYAGIWGTDEFLFLSRYDGLRYVRLNPLGAYCLGIAKAYRPTLAAKPPLLAVDGDLGLTLLRAPEPAEGLLLERIATPLSSDLWRLDPDLVLRHSADAEERGRIRDFLETSSSTELPAQVRELLDTVGERATALADIGPARLIRCKDAAIAALLATDPVTAPHCARSGDRLLCVSNQKLAAFRKGLAKLGFVLPEAGLG